jgi:hypothetical protein
MVLRFLICGLEHSGTTLISDLFRQLPEIDSGFEVGVLLRDSPAAFRDLQPFADNMLSGWGIDETTFEHCCAAPDFETFYARLMAASTVLAPDTRAIFDKTPRYLSDLEAVLDRSNVPVVIGYKDPRAMVCFDFKRARDEDFDSWYADYKPRKLRYVQKCYRQFMAHRDNPRVTTVGLEELAMNARATMQRMFAHVGERFELSYAVIDTLRYDNVKSRTVSADIAFEYMTDLITNAKARIIKGLCGFRACVSSCLAWPMAGLGA